ncbi:MAG TPA: hypothetical protein VHB77_02510 [Planctomycetaceae bacterium]|nr:hypothetical protein [Planctomycetaceae bacterium]
MKDQLIRDLKASWQKTAALAVLLVVGLAFWVPPLVRVLSAGASAPAAASPAPSSAPATLAARPTITADAAPAFAWEQAAAYLDTDPFVRSAEVAAVQRDPFRLDRDQFAPPILFSDELPPPPPPPAPTRPSDGTIAGLELKSTIIGARRRAALINSHLYYEGREVFVDGVTYTLTSVQPRRVILSRGQDVFELEIPNPGMSGPHPGSFPR